MIWAAWYLAAACTNSHRYDILSLVDRPCWCALVGPSMACVSLSRGPLDGHLWWDMYATRYGARTARSISNQTVWTPRSGSWSAHGPTPPEVAWDFLEQHAIATTARLRHSGCIRLARTSSRTSDPKVRFLLKIVYELAAAAVLVMIGWTRKTFMVFLGSVTRRRILWDGFSSSPIYWNTGHGRIGRSLTAEAGFAIPASMSIPSTV